MIMRKTKVNHVIEYFALTLILSYFFIHNILLVLTGIIFSLYLININFFNRIIRTIIKNLVIKNESIELNENDKEIKTKPINTKLTKEDRKLTLVETVEELGFIPSIDENDESTAA